MLKKEQLVPVQSKGEIDESPFDLILSANILTAQDLDKLVPLKQELKETFLKSQVFRTRTEMETSILNDIAYPTAASKYWQAVREQNVMFYELVMLSYEYRRSIVELKKLQRSLKGERDALEKEALQIEIEKQMFVLRNYERTAKDRIREIVAWSEIKQQQSCSMTAAELDDVDNHQLISYTMRWIKQCQVMGTSGSPAERRNLLGQMRSGILTCHKKGVLGIVLSEFSRDAKKQISEELRRLLEEKV